MEHFPIVLALARAASYSRNQAVLQHIERLREALAQDGADDQVQALDHVLEYARTPKEELPPRVRVVHSNKGP